MKTRLGHYDIVAELGRGGMGVVYKGHESSLNRYVAIKVLADSLAHDEGVKERFLREARSMAALNDPHIIQIYYIGEDEGQPFFVMEFVEGESLGTLLKRERKELHGLVADTIEKLSAGHLEYQIDVLARHYFWSDYKDRALHYLILAGQKSGRNHNTSQSQKYFEDALSLLPKVAHTPQQAVQVHSGLGDALALAGDYPATRAAYQKALQAVAAEPNANAETVCELQRKIGMTHERQGDYDLALECLDQANNVLLVPVEALHTQPDGSLVVYVLAADGMPEQRTVQVGMQDYTNAEIRSGLQAGELVITQGPGIPN